MNDTPETDDTWDSDLRNKCQKLERERDRLAEALRKCREDSVCHQRRMEDLGYTYAAKESQANSDRAYIALQSLNQNETNPAAGSKKTNMENQNNSENQSAAMPCSPYPCRKTHDADWIPALFAPKDRKIMGFFEDIGWYPACWSEDKQMWCISYCAGVPDTNPEEPRWIQRLIYADYICWWREWPNQTHPRHSEENSQADRPNV